MSTAETAAMPGSMPGAMTEGLAAHAPVSP